MILAAGLGTRLAPLTDKTAKPALPFLGKPIIHSAIQFLHNSGIDEFVINLHRLPDTVRKAVDPLNLNVRYSFEKKLLGTAGGLKKVERFLSDGTFVMINADCFYTGNLINALDSHRESGAIATMLLKDYDDESYNPVIVDENTGKAISIAGKPEKRTGVRKIFTGIHILEPDIFRFIPPNTACDINSGVYVNILTSGAGKISYFPYDGFWSDLGTPVRIAAAEKHLRLNA